MAKSRNSGMTNNVKMQVNAPTVPNPQTDDDQQDDQQDQTQGQQGNAKYPSDPEQLLQWFQTATDQDADDLLADVRSQAIDNDSRQQDDDITRFFNQIGWTSRVPEVLSEANYQQALQQVTQQTGAKPQQMYHSDHPYGGVGARQFAQQFMGQGYDFAGNAYRQYMSNGIYGNGTYFADSASESAGYGPSQYRGFFNSNAKIGDYYQLSSQLSAFRKQNPAFDRFFSKITGGYSGTTRHDDEAAISVFAAMKGYNIIHNGYDYYCVLDRSAVTVSSMTKKAQRGMKDW